jgi:hypothetical protein
MTSVIKSGTPCYLVGLGRFSWVDGRVVTVVQGPTIIKDGFDPVYAICAAWLTEMFPHQPFVAYRRNLLPILPPAADIEQQNAALSVSAAPG